MAHIILPHRWTSQPKYPVGIDWGNPLTNGLVFAHNHAQGVVDAVKGVSGTIGAGYGLEASMYGLGGNKTTTAGITHTRRFSAYSDNVSLLSVFAVTSLFNNTSTAYYLRPTTVSGSGIRHAPFTGGATIEAIAYAYPDYTTSNTLSTTISANNHYALVQTFARNSSHALYSNGELAASSAGFNYAYSFNSATIAQCTSDTRSGIQLLSAIWLRTLTRGEVIAISRNPWQIFKPLQRRIWVPVSAGGVSGTLSITLDNLTSSISGTTTIVGTMGVSLASHTSSIQGSPTNVGTIEVLLADNTSSIQGSPVNVGSIAVALEVHTPSISGTVGGGVEGTLSPTLDNNTSSIQGSPVISGTMNTSLQDVSSSMQGTTTIVGTLAVTLDNFVSNINNFITGVVSRINRLFKYLGRR